MNDDERALADDLYDCIMIASDTTPRSLQASAFKVGISDLGFCSERTKRMLHQMVPEPSDTLAAFIGTAMGDYVERAYVDQHPDVIRQAEVSLDLTGESGNAYTITGHPDLIDPTGVLIDVKTTRGLGIISRTGPSQQQQFQRHCYAKAAWQGGLFNDDVALEDVRVANAWLDRAADNHNAVVQMEPYDEGIVEQASMWLDEVVYSYLNDTEARKEPPREMCAKVCGFYATCRLHETDVEGLLTDDTVLAAIDMHAEATAMERTARKMKDEAKAHLKDVTGSTGKHMVRWVWVNGSHVEFDREGYYKLDVRKVK